MTIIIKHFEHDSIADGNSVSKTWPSDADYTVKYVLIKRKDGQPLTASDITIYIGNTPMTMDKALASTFGSDRLNALELDWELTRDTEFKYTFTNREGATISIVVELVLERR